MFGQVGFYVSLVLIFLLLWMTISQSRILRKFKHNYLLQKAVVAEMLLTMIEDAQDTDGYTWRQLEVLESAALIIKVNFIKRIDPVTKEWVYSFEPKVTKRVEEYTTALYRTCGLYPDDFPDGIMPSLVRRSQKEKTSVGNPIHRE